MSGRSLAHLGRRADKMTRREVEERVRLLGENWQVVDRGSAFKKSERYQIWQFLNALAGIKRIEARGGSWADAYHGLDDRYLHRIAGLEAVVYAADTPTPSEEVARWPEHLTEAWKERAAILEAEGLARTWADRRALAMVKEEFGLHVLDGPPPDRWTVLGLGF